MQVVGDPRRFGRSPTEFHEANQHLRSEWKYAMSGDGNPMIPNAGEDARVRLDVLSEIPDVWQREVQRWSELNQNCRTALNVKSLGSRPQ